MRSIIVTAVLAFLAQAPATEIATNHMDDEQDFMDALVDKLVGKLFQRALGKPTQLSVAPCTGLLNTRPRVSSGVVSSFQLRSSVPTRSCGMFGAMRDDAQLQPITEQPALGQPLGRRAMGSKAAAALTAALIGIPNPTRAFGPQNIPLEIAGYDDIKCPPGVPKNARCINVRAKVDNNFGKGIAYNSEVFGRVKFSNGESAIYGDFAESSDAGKIADIEEIPEGPTEVSFLLKLTKDSPEDKLSFPVMKVRAYPGMRKNFRVMKPVEETCDPEKEACDDDE